ncbi:MAG: hypothetical protein M3328_06620, partial [Chloroflexota bacterium]|nr:hypothetical protein [Chloroflexota bacterium]
MATVIEQQSALAPAIEETAPKEKTVIPRKPMSPGKFIAFLVLSAMSILFIVPFLWMFSTSLKDFGDLAGTNWIPNPVTWDNYGKAFSYGMWGRWALNSVTITAFAVFGTVLSTSIIAYSFARLRWPGRDQVFALVLATMMLPGVVTMIPQYILFSKLPAFGFMGSETWVNTFLPLTVPAFT